MCSKRWMLVIRQLKKLDEVMLHFLKSIFSVILLVLMLMLFLNCENNVPEQDPMIVLTKERVLYENSEFNNCNPRAIFSENSEEIYIVFTRVPPTYSIRMEMSLNLPFTLVQLSHSLHFPISFSLMAGNL